MNMPLYEQLVELDRIDPDDATHRITTRSGLDDLTASITRLGVIHAPILQARGDRWRIIAGFRRIAACRAIGRTDVTVKVLPADAAHHQRVELAIADNSLQRPLNLVETARSLKLLSGCHASRGELTAAATALNLPGNPDLLQKLLRLATLSKSIQEAVIDEVIALSMALALAELENPLADEWIRIFRDLNIGLNRQRELLSLVAEIAIREDQSDADVLFGPAVRQILSPTDVDAAQKYRMLSAHLRQRRFPHVTRAARRFDDLVRTLALGPHAQLSPPAHFEGTQYQLRLLFRSPDDLQKHRQTIEELLENPNFKAILE
jgi:ParB family chromosome partitioning protein